MVKFFFKNVIFSLPNKKKLKEFIIGIFLAEVTPFDNVSFVICSDEFLLNINQQHLQHDDLTDVITFTLSDPKEPIAGEIYISAERIRENAASFKTKLQIEMHRVIFHGVLHLCGYTDKTEKDKQIMSEKENEYLQKYFHTVPRIPVSA